MLGSLSATYESNGDPGCISGGEGDYGGKSYGCFQFALNAGIPEAFVESIADTEIGMLLSAEVGSDTFDNQWRTIGSTRTSEFSELQRLYVQSVYYDAAVENLRNIGFDALSRSEALQQVLWSRAVQYSAHWMPELFQKAAGLAGESLDTIGDHNLIYYIYEYCIEDGDWHQGSFDVQTALISRFNSERLDALEMLG
jgi:hypothetical protein